MKEMRRIKQSKEEKMLKKMLNYFFTPKNLRNLDWYKISLSLCMTRWSTLEEDATSNSNPSNSTLYPSNSTLIFNVNKDIPIATWKGVTSCNKHPLSNFMSYDKINNK